MRPSFPDSWRKIGGGCALVVFALAVATIAWGKIQLTLDQPREKEALSTAEAAAQQDPAAAPALQALVERQTARSLKTVRRERISIWVALLGAATALVLLREWGADKPGLPPTLRSCLPTHVDATGSSETEGEILQAPSPGEAATPVQRDNVDVSAVAQIVDRVGSAEHQLIPLLHAIQEHYLYLPEEALEKLCELTGIRAAQVMGVASFYTKFRMKPRGEHLWQICRGTACHVTGADRVLEELRRHLGIAPGEDTDPALRATVEAVGCLGCCSLAPVIQQDERLYERVRVEDLPPLVSACRDNGGVHEESYWPAVQKISRLNGRFPGSTSRNGTGHHHSVKWPRWLGSLLKPAESRETPPRIPAATLLTAPSVEGRPADAVQVVTGHWSGGQEITLDEYQRDAGFAALASALGKRDRQGIIDQVEASGLRGRGGGGFLTARKWRLVAAGTGEKVVICNGDEGDPGAFMDRSIMETSPYSVLEGMLLAGYAVGAQRGIVYVRNEYPTAVARMRAAVHELRERGILGSAIFGSDFSFDIDVVEGGGAFVCGEETALIESLMGRRGTPLARPPFPAESGLDHRPTLVNNVETLACVPWIVQHGADRFAALGTANSAGTKVFSLAGKVRHGGLVEVPLGTTIRELVEHYGGGVPGGRQFKAVQIGGPSGGCIPAELVDTPLDYEALRELGAIMGSGGVVVLDDTDCMVDVARYFLEFTQQESCGHCTFCRVGTKKLLDILERICQGHATHRELAEAETLSRSIVLGSLCGLGKTAPNPVLTTLRYFREEYEAHLEGKCPAGRCKDLIQYQVTTDCVGCTLCAQHCPVAAIEATPYRQHLIDSTVCTRCDACRTTCPEDAIRVIPLTNPRQRRKVAV